MSRDSTYLLDTARAARLIIEFSQGLDRATFLADVRTQSAILHQFMMVWDTATVDVPELLALLEPHLPEDEP